MPSPGRFGPGAPPPGFAAAVALAGLLAPIGCAARQAAQDPAPAVPAPATTGPSVRAAWEDAYLAFSSIQSALQEPGPALTVTGLGEVEAVPNRARISFAVETEGETAREAGEANAELMESVSAALRTAGTGLPGFRLETSGYSLNPRYAPATGDRTMRIVGYAARNTVRITADQVEGLGPLIDEALGAGANRVSGLVFELRDPEPYRHEAMRLAVGKARAEAAVIAEALGMRLGPPIDVQGGADYVPPPMPYGMGRGLELAAAQAVPTPVEPGLQRVSARVTIRFRLDESP